MEKMFCFQCEQTANCSGCTGNAGVCGKTSDVADLQDKLVGALIGLARAMEENEPTEETNRLMIEGLFTTLTNVNFNRESIQQKIDEVHRVKDEIMKDCRTCKNQCGKAEDYDMNEIWHADEDTRSLKSLVVFGLKGMAAYASSKAAVNAVVKVMAKEMADRRIRVNGVAPAFVATPMIKEDMDMWEKEGNSPQKFGVIPPKQVAGLIGFLMSEQAAYITGEIISISAGMIY